MSLPEPSRRLPEHPAILRIRGCTPYRDAWQAMQAFTAQRDETTPDEIWVMEHPAVFTLGRNGRYEHILSTDGIPVVPTDRGGQVTYHGPGQAMIYPLLDIARLGLGVRDLVSALERAVIAALAAAGIRARSDAAAPGVYVADDKIASIGLRIRRGCSYHGVALNVDMDLGPFARINPCGRVGLRMTQCADLGAAGPTALWGESVAQAIAAELGLALDPTGAGPDTIDTGDLIRT